MALSHVLLKYRLLEDWDPDPDPSLDPPTEFTVIDQAEAILVTNSLFLVHRQITKEIRDLVGPRYQGLSLEEIADQIWRHGSDCYLNLDFSNGIVELALGNVLYAYRIDWIPEEAQSEPLFFKTYLTEDHRKIDKSFFAMMHQCYTARDLDQLLKSPPKNLVPYSGADSKILFVDEFGRGDRYDLVTVAPTYFPFETLLNWRRSVERTAKRSGVQRKHAVSLDM